MDVLIAAGGTGTRLWPLSRANQPKPLLPIAGGVSPLKRAVSVARRVAPRGHIWVVTGPRLASRVRAHLGARAAVRLVIEPASRNTAAALAMGVEVIKRRTGARHVLCMPADQWIRNPSAFAKLVRLAARRAPDSLITFGIPPKSPHTGYGYIEAAPHERGAVRRVRRFVEKPDAKRASRFVRSGRWLWNAGIFLVPVGEFLRQVNELLPEVGRAVSALASSSGRRRRRGLSLWRRLRRISVDHGIFERARSVMVACGEFGWQDLGSWEAIAQTLPRTADGTAVRGAYLPVSGGDCFIYAPEHLTVNLGTRGVGLVVTRDAILMFQRRRHEDVRQVVHRLNLSSRFARYR